MHSIERKRSRKASGSSIGPSPGMRDVIEAPRQPQRASVASISVGLRAHLTAYLITVLLFDLLFSQNATSLHPSSVSIYLPPLTFGKSVSGPTWGYIVLVREDALLIPYLRFFFGHLRLIASRYDTWLPMMPNKLKIGAPVKSNSVRQQHGKPAPCAISLTRYTRTSTIGSSAGFGALRALPRPKALEVELIDQAPGMRTGDLYSDIQARNTPQGSTVSRRVSSPTKYLAMITL
ncbi:hypothetical protein GGS23DRAFT_544969 [Durotheca rogersii]|uniref:uncharacterized protein n=1 Tax=Durotheca rogersii TaxID=419775 RepID=UPI00221F0FF5|nr:uncharacterized protein GGS23DRAFT_544969 [Durotheca rogersii]KAI5868327.1 hypothetical protein GGS23DRAFT_544969 [Durotheca rogersii]